MDGLRKVYDQLRSHAGGHSFTFDLRPLYEEFLSKFNKPSQELTGNPSAAISTSIPDTSPIKPQSDYLHDAFLIRELNITIGSVVIPEEQYIYGYGDLSFEEFCSYIHWRSRVRNKDIDVLCIAPKSFLYLHLFELCNFVEYSDVDSVIQMLQWLSDNTEVSLSHIIKNALHEFALLYSEKEIDDTHFFSEHEQRFDRIIRAKRILNGDFSGMLDYIITYSTKSVKKSCVFRDHEPLIRKAFPDAIKCANDYLHQRGISFVELWMGQSKLRSLHLRFIKEINKEKVVTKVFSQLGTTFVEVTKEGIYEITMDSLGQKLDPGQCLFARAYVMQCFYSLFEIELRKILELRTIKPKMADMWRMSSYSPILMSLCQEFESSSFRKCLAAAIQSAV